MKEDHTWAPTFPYESSFTQRKNEAEAGWMRLSVHSKHDNNRLSPSTPFFRILATLSHLPSSRPAELSISVFHIPPAPRLRPPPSRQPIGFGSFDKLLLRSALVSLPTPSTQNQHCCLRPASDSACHLQLPGSWLYCSTWCLVSVSAPVCLDFGAFYF